MSCIKEEKRNVFNIFTVYTCNNCEYFIDDELIMIGKCAIRIYPIFQRCIFDSIDEFMHLESKRLAKMLKEVSRYLELFDDILFLWVDDASDVIRFNEGFFDAMFAQGISIVMIY